MFASFYLSLPISRFVYTTVEQEFNNDTVKPA